MSLLSRFFGDRSPPPKTVDDHLLDIEKSLVNELSQLDEPSSSETWSKEEINTQLLSLEKIDELRERKKRRERRSFFHTPAGASVLTAIFTITATQIPAMTQMYVTHQTQEEGRYLKPVLEIVANDETLNLGEKLAVIDFVSSYHYREENVEEFLDRYRSGTKNRANER